MLCNELQVPNPLQFDLIASIHLGGIRKDEVQLSGIFPACLFDAHSSTFFFRRAPVSLIPSIWIFNWWWPAFKNGVCGHIAAALRALRRALNQLVSDKFVSCDGVVMCGVCIPVRGSYAKIFMCSAWQAPATSSQWSLEGPLIRQPCQMHCGLAA